MSVLDTLAFVFDTLQTVWGSTVTRYHSTVAMRLHWGILLAVALYTALLMLDSSSSDYLTILLFKSAHAAVCSVWLTLLTLANHLSVKPTA
jgi:cytochrome b561